MTESQLKEELLETYMQYYVEGFKTNNVALIDHMVKYPLTYLKDGKMILCEQYPIDPQKLKAEKAWDHSTDWQFEIQGINDKEAHAVAFAVRRRADGSKIESVHGFYAFSRTSEGWKMYALADITF
ncbi:hypothetical protein [Thalassomonas actiniarum]|uniref:Uncharacterized protein n=1 Tax=Thalassomonas actiniarum TaxID=485447 RepID=A0AAE9YUW5_9GAMM|nr:hypothetical protein [Thalassomonas actiniarum]WDE01676.1 hypothetical protein SG35_014225 [Thalassomonas actiniarum]